MKIDTVVSHGETLEGMQTNLEGLRYELQRAKQRLADAEYETVKWLAENGCHHMLKLDPQRLKDEVEFKRRTRR